MLDLWDVCTRLGVTISKVFGPPVFRIKAGASRLVPHSVLRDTFTYLDSLHAALFQENLEVLLVRATISRVCEVEAELKLISEKKAITFPGTAIISKSA